MMTTLSQHRIRQRCRTWQRLAEVRLAAVVRCTTIDSGPASRLTARHSGEWPPQKRGKGLFHHTQNSNRMCAARDIDDPTRKQTH